jgi:hypothetical protein
MGDNLWSRQALIKYIDDANKPLEIDMTGDEIKALYLELSNRVGMAINEAKIGRVQIEKWKLPATIKSIVHGYTMAATMAYGTKFGAYPTPSQTNYLANADVGSYDPIALPEYIAPDADWSFDMVEAPAQLKTNLEAAELAVAFYNQMLKKTEHQNPTPILGEYRMTKTGLDLIDDLGLKEIRFVITPVGFWLSCIIPNGRYIPAWWSPQGDSLTTTYGQRYAWAFRTFAACLWHDLHDTKVTAWKVTKDRERRQITKREKDEVVIVLPRTIKNLTWEDGVRHSWEGSEKKDYSVRAHYRRLHESWWQPSEDAIKAALEQGFPEPPEGYTFVRPYDVGDGGLDVPPRLVAKGLQAAKVALARL